MNSKLALLKKAYSLLDEVTPLKFDCGSLCGGKCCDCSSVESTDNPGMLLLPYEDKLTVSDGFRIEQGEDGKVLICGGRCDRDLRPFSCRIFPFYARITDDNKISLRIDPRAFLTCPIAQKKKGTRHSVYFHRNALRAVRVLMKDEDFKKELIKTSEFCDGLYSFYRKML